MIFNQVEDKNPAIKDGWTVLHCAAESGNEEIILKILKAVKSWSSQLANFTDNKNHVSFENLISLIGCTIICMTIIASQ